MSTIAGTKTHYQICNAFILEIKPLYNVLSLYLLSPILVSNDLIMLRGSIIIVPDSIYIILVY